MFKFFLLSEIAHAILNPKQIVLFSITINYGNTNDHYKGGKQNGNQTTYQIFRNRKGMTQKQLGEQLGFAEKPQDTAWLSMNLKPEFLRLIL